jgi:hypothetical protein
MARERLQYAMEIILVVVSNEGRRKGEASSERTRLSSWAAGTRIALFGSKSDQ